MKIKENYLTSLAIFLILLFSFTAIYYLTPSTNQAAEATKSETVKKTKKNNSDDKNLIALKDFKYNKSSEKKEYPNLNQHPNAWIDVNIATQRVYIKEGTHILYAMYSSTGKDDATPRGTYYIQSEKGDYFYTEPLKMGAYYWVSFLHHGEYLFHTTPTDENGDYLKSVSKTLGRTPSSHGCIHLSTPDCKWIYENAPTGMKVVIHGKYPKTTLA